MDPKNIPGSIAYQDITPPNDKPRIYWMVHGGVSGQPSSVIHFTRESAETEAKRLAEVNVGRCFFVVEAISMFKVSRPAASQVVFNRHN